MYVRCWSEVDVNAEVRLLRISALLRMGRRPVGISVCTVYLRGVIEEEDDNNDDDDDDDDKDDDDDDDDIRGYLS